jgi:xylanolytic transcriptional activator XlnR
VAEITRRLNIYAKSLHGLESFHLRSVPTPGKWGIHSASHVIDYIQSSKQPFPHPEPQGNQNSLLKKVVITYGTYFTHVLHILLTGKWDPISPLDNKDLWTSSESFIATMGHAICAADFVADILKCDPYISFIQFFFGIYSIPRQSVAASYSRKVRSCS